MRSKRFRPVICFCALLGLLSAFSVPRSLADTTVGGTISADTTWTLSGSPYIVTSSIIVKGTDGTDGITTLTIEPGVEVRFSRYQMMTIGAASGDPGALSAQGTAADPIVFTSAEASPAAGDWYNLTFNNTTDDATTILDHCVVEYSGYSQGAIYLNNASPTISNTQVRHSKYKGIYVSTGQPVIDACQFSDNLNYDLYYSGTVGGSVSNSTINSGIYLVATGTVTFSGNTINQNNSFPIVTYADNVGGIVGGSTIAGVDSASYLQVNAGTISHDATWNAQIPYYIYGSLTLKGADGADGITTLTLLPGARLKFKKYTQMTIGATSGDPGALSAQGTAADPIVFTSAEASPAAGDWFNLTFNNTADDATTILDHCVVEYSGYSQGAIYLNNASPRINNTTVRYSKYAGIYGLGTGTGTADINCNTFSGNKKGIHWTASPAPEMHGNNFSGNSEQGIYYSGAVTLNAEDNWWGDAAGPNAAGDAAFGNVDADPWSVQENDCTGPVENQPPNVPSNPAPDDAAVRVASDSGVTLSWTGGDPNPQDSVTYDLYWGAAADAMQLEVSDLTQNTYMKSPVGEGTTYYWKIVARDDKSTETPGPIWHFTTNGDSPDLIVSALTADPAGNLQSGQSVTFTALVQNSGNGPVVDPFTLDFQIDGASIGTAPVGSVILAGGSTQVSMQWTYNTGDPGIDIYADSQNQVVETDDANNHYFAQLSEVADNSAPVLVGSSPADAQYLQQIQQIAITLTDSQGTVDDAAVIASFSVSDSSQQSISGSISESDDTFIFVPDSLPLADSTYQVAFIAADTFGNSQNHTLSFTIDAQPPAKPAITGGVVDSGTIQPRPAQNLTSQFSVELTGTREAGTSLWINGVETVTAGDSAWTVPLSLSPGANAFEIWLKDLAGNQGESEWVDIEMRSGNGTTYEYNEAGRMKRTNNAQ